MTSVVSCTRRLFFTVLLTVVAAGVSAAGPASEGVNAAVEWNAVATQAFFATQGTDPLRQSRAYAMLHAAIHDALNAIRQRYEFYTPAILMIPGASPDAAVAAAARDVLVALIPAQQPLIQDAYEAALAAISDGPAKNDGVILGQAAAASILDRRFNDGVAEAFTTPYVPTGLPGDYTFTPPFDFAFAPGWGAVTPVGIDLDDHRVPGPNPITSVVYALDFAYVKAIGAVNSTHRSAEQSEIARFWYEDSPIGWNRIANRLLRDRIRYSTTSVTEPGVTRHFRGFTDAAVENGWSRVYAGIHFVRAVADG